MQHNNLPWLSFCLQQSTWCQIRRTDVFNVKNQDTLHNTALTSDVMNVMNMDILPCTALTKYPFQEHQHHMTRHTGTTTPDWALDTTGKTKKEETGPDHSLGTAGIAAPAVMTCTEATPEHNNRMGTATIGAAQDNPIQHTKDTVTDPTVTHHIGHTINHPHTAAHWVTTIRTTVDHIHTHPTDCQNIIHTKEDPAVQDCTPIRELKNYTLAGIWKST